MYIQFLLNLLLCSCISRALSNECFCKLLRVTCINSLLLLLLLLLVGEQQSPLSLVSPYSCRSRVNTEMEILLAGLVWVVRIVPGNFQTILATLLIPSKSLKTSKAHSHIISRSPDDILRLSGRLYGNQTIYGFQFYTSDWYSPNHCSLYQRCFYMKP